MTEEVMENQAINESEGAVAQQEKMLSQTEVNEIAGRVRQEAYEKARREAMAEAESKLAKQAAESSPQQISQGGLSRDEATKLIHEEAARLQEQRLREEAAKQVVGQFVDKLSEGAKSYEDFENVVSSMGLESMPELVQLTNSVDNTADVIYDLAKNPYKVGNILSLNERSPSLAAAEIRRLSQSINTNKEAQASQMAREPLGQMKPSASKTDNGDLGVRDYMSQPWLRR